MATLSVAAGGIKTHPRGGVRLNRILNSVAIAVVAFFGFLAVFTFSGLPSARGQEAPHATLSLVTAEWAKGEQGRIDVRIVVHNQGNPAEARAIRYETTLDGIPFDEGAQALDDKLPIARDTDIHFTTDLGQDFASRWWSAQAAVDSSTLAIRGELEIREGSTDRTLPFEWTSSSRLPVPSLFSALEDCPSSAPVCLETVAAGWDTKTLSATMTLRNQAAEDLWVAGGQVGLSFDGVEVASAEVQQTLIPAEGSQTFQVTFASDDAALDEWWTNHARRCEESPAQVHVAMALQDAYGWPVGTASWVTPEATLRTSLLCNGGPA